MLFCFEFLQVRLALRFNCLLIMPNDSIFHLPGIDIMLLCNRKVRLSIAAVATDVYSEFELVRQRFSMHYVYASLSLIIILLADYFYYLPVVFSFRKIILTKSLPIHR